MVKSYIVRKDLFEEEHKEENKISQQVCVVIEHIYNKKVTYYESSKQNGVLMQGEVLYTNVPLQGTERLIFYVKDPEIAMKLAKRWCDENTSKEHKYKVIGVDHYYSPLD